MTIGNVFFQIFFGGPFVCVCFSLFLFLFNKRKISLKKEKNYIRGLSHER